MVLVIVTGYDLCQFGWWGMVYCWLWSMQWGLGEALGGC